MRKKEFPSEKILEISKEDYFKNKGKTIEDYILKSVIKENASPAHITYIISNLVPRGTEVVVEYKREHYKTKGNYGNGMQDFDAVNAYGLALIPRKNSRESKS